MSRFKYILSVAYQEVGQNKAYKREFRKTAVGWDSDIFESRAESRRSDISGSVVGEKVGTDYYNRVIERVGYYRNPQRTGPNKKIAKDCAKKQAWNEAEELEMQNAEYEGSEPDAEMSVPVL